MKQIIIKSARMENFKRFHEKTIEFGEKVTSIFGQNYRGKSSVADLFSWVMFNKSSTGNTEGSQFRPRRYDENGVNIDHVDVVGELILMIDGEEVKIRKVQRQKWVRHKGDDYDSYMGDETLYEWNDVPVSATNHKKKVEEIISEEVFRMISNPAAFPSMDAKKQREFLLKNVANITDADVFALNPEFDFVKDAMGKNTLEELEARTKKEIAAYKDKQKEIPVRIDQESKRIENVDFSEKEMQLESLQAELANVEAKLEDTGKAYEKLNELKMKQAIIRSEIEDLKAVLEAKRKANVKTIQDYIKNAENDIYTLRAAIKSKENQLEIHKTSNEVDERGLEALRKKYSDAMAMKLDENAFICPVCKQTIPEDQQEKIRADFEEEKKNTIAGLNEKGKVLNQHVQERKTSISVLEIEISKLKEKEASVIRIKEEQEKLLSNVQSQPLNVGSEEEYASMQEKIAEADKLDKEISEISTADADALREQLKSQRTTIQEAILEVNKSLAMKSVIERSKAAVEALKAEMVEVTQSLANREKLENAIDKFKRAKMDMLSERINGKFKVVKWKLFELQKNQKFADVCVCMVNGSCYGENTTSATERMMAGMDIISTLQEIYQVEAPIFLDDADLYNEWNIPAMDSQLIKLCVSEDEDLRIEKEY